MASAMHTSVDQPLGGDTNNTYSIGAGALA
jgi:hypothetical protein